ncbi:MAG: hypothetical protein OXE93_04920 [bacterium]|nr:hypothetical protein [bacterium]MCY4257337.1 hypothetical protein [bacterium]
MATSEPIGDRRRLALMLRLNEVLGEEEASTIMESLPPTIWQNIATKDDLNDLADRLCAQFDSKFAKVDAEFAKVDGEFAKVNAKVDGGFAKVDAEFALIRGEMEKNKGEIMQMMASQTRTIILALTGFAVTIWISLLVVGIT